MKIWYWGVLVIGLAGCAAAPVGPSVMALPGTGKSFEQFRVDDAECRQYAQWQIGGEQATQSINQPGVTSAAVGTAIGAVAGAAIGGRDAAGVGAGVGLITGSMAGAGESQARGYGAQRSYDHAYIQCMYAKGQQVPVAAPPRRVVAPVPLSAPVYIPPPPPPGY